MLSLSHRFVSDTLFWITRKKWLIISFLLSIILFYLPSPEGLTSEGHRTLIIVLTTLILIISESIPLPATMIHDMGALVSGQKGGIKLKLYSDFPFPNRAGTQLDSFSQNAMQTFRNGKVEDPVISVENYEGVESVRVSIVDFMVAPGCVNCHNTRADSPKVDLGLELEEARDAKKSDSKPWVDVWSAGQGVGSVNDLPTTAELVSRLKAEYLQSHQEQQTRVCQFDG